MKPLSFVFKNIKNFFLHHTVMFFFLIIVQIICCVSVFIVCGMANNMYYVEDTGKQGTNDAFLIGFGEGVNYSTSFEYDDDHNLIDRYYIVDGKKTRFVDCSSYPSLSEMRPLLERLSDSIGDDFGFCDINFITNGKLDAKDFDSIQEIGSIFPGNTETAGGHLFENTKNYVFSGESKEYTDGDTITINGIEYSYTSTPYGLLTIPYNVAQDCFRIKSMWVVLTELPTAHRLTEVQNIINDIFGTDIRTVEIPETYEPTERQISQMVYIISLIVMVIILFALAKFYSYVLSNRQNALTVLRLCGGTKRQIHLIYMIEIFLTMIVTSALGFVVFKYLCYQPIAEMYPSFDVFFTPDIYIIITTAYILLALIIMAITIIPATKASIIDMKRG